MQQSAPAPGSGGNVIAALASLVLPGLGQLAQGRVLSALLQLVFSGVLWLISFGWLGWLGHILAALDAALWRGPGETYRRVDGRRIGVGEASAFDGVWVNKRAIACPNADTLNAARPSRSYADPLIRRPADPFPLSPRDPGRMISD